MCNYITSSVSSCYHFCVPNFIAQQLETVASELNFCLEKIYVGPSSYRYQGDGDELLKKKSFYVANNPWDLAKSLLIYGIIAAVGYFLATSGLLWIGYGIMVGAGFFAVAEVKENLADNHLKQALEQIAPPFDTLKTVEWQQTRLKKIILDPSQITEPVMRGVNEKNETVLIVFKQPAPAGVKYQAHIKVLYFGSNFFTRSTEIKDNFLIESRNVLNGTEIGALKTIV